MGEWVITSWFVRGEAQPRLPCAPVWACAHHGAEEAPTFFVSEASKDGERSTRVQSHLVRRERRCTCMVAHDLKGS